MTKVSMHVCIQLHVPSWGVGGGRVEKEERGGGTVGVGCNSSYVVS